MKFDDTKHQYSSNGEKFYSITQLRDLLLRGKNPAFGEDLNRIKEYANAHGSVTATDIGMSQKDFDFMSKGVIGQGIKGDVFHSTIDKIVKAGVTSLEELQQKDLSAFQSYQKERENALKELQKYGLALPAIGLQARNAFEKVIEGNDITFKIKSEINNVNLLFKLVKQTNYVTVLAASTVIGESGVCAIPIDLPEADMEGCIHTMKNGYTKNAAREFINMLHTPATLWKEIALPNG